MKIRLIRPAEEKGMVELGPVVEVPAAHGRDLINKKWAVEVAVDKHRPPGNHPRIETAAYGGGALRGNGRAGSLRNRRIGR